MTDPRGTPPRGEPEPLDPRLRAAVALLRDAPEPSAAWRAGVVAAARRRGGARITTTRRLVFAALAAGVGGILLGGGAVWMVLRPGADPAARTAGGSRLEPVATTVRFRLVAPEAARVSVVGDFNHWDPVRTPMRRAADGRSWEIVIPLVPGRYEYSFMVDGVLATDPTAPRAPDADYGAPNSIVYVRGSM